MWFLTFSVIFNIIIRNILLASIHKKNKNVCIIYLHPQPGSSDHYIANKCCKYCGDLSVSHILYLFVFSFDWQVKLLRICTPHSYGSPSVLFLAIYMMDYLWALSPLSGLSGAVCTSLWKSETLLYLIPSSLMLQSVSPLLECTEFSASVWRKRRLLVVRKTINIFSHNAHCQEGAG